MKSDQMPFALRVNTEKKTVKSQQKLPQATELEESVLGALMIERDALTDVIDILSPESFHREQHALIYQAIVKLFNNTEVVDPRMVMSQLRKDGNLDKIGGPAYIATLIESVATAKNIENHARVIVEYAMRRSLIKVSARIQEDAYDETIDTFSLLDKSEQALFDVSESNIRKNYTDVGTLMGVAIKELKVKKENKDGVIGIPTGFIALDRIILGWQKADFVVIAARPGMGKTAFMLSLLRNAAIDHQTPVAFFSLEMSSIQLTNRMICAESSLSSDKVKRGNLAEYEWQQLYHKTAKLSQAPIYIDDTPALSLFEFRAKCRRLKAQKNIKVIFVDYLQLMVDTTVRNSGNREQQIASISRGIKSIAKELDITIVVASQLSRSVETRGGDKRPMLSDLRESGAIEQDADIVIFLYRPAYYGITQDETGKDATDLAEIMISKHRNGATGKINLRYLDSITQFVDYETEQEFVESSMNENDDMPFF